MDTVSTAAAIEAQDRFRLARPAGTIDRLMVLWSVRPRCEMAHLPQTPPPALPAGFLVSDPCCCAQRAAGEGEQSLYCRTWSQHRHGRAEQMRYGGSYNEAPCNEPFRGRDEFSAVPSFREESATISRIRSPYSASAVPIPRTAFVSPRPPSRETAAHTFERSCDILLRVPCTTNALPAEQLLCVPLVGEFSERAQSGVGTRRGQAADLAKPGPVRITRFRERCSILTIIFRAPARVTIKFGN
jgi:hypothetical protein